MDPSSILVSDLSFNLSFQLQLGTSRNVWIFSISEMKAPLNRCPSADPFGLSGVFPGTIGLGKQLHIPGGGGIPGPRD